ncbi:MAG TPA: hypothetical protein PLL19_07565 [Thiobacillaceae bacterium]|nr:hypothetical protein [Thiobacillaceae bacterium]HNA82611.1 hypothetical protein [Thiobacillaceae bacterium]HNF89171.1 hypothetical protein [Thiobacillaceae bacterium]HNL23041.1 hypothetical protein [Rhodocyclaceae bacterium]HNO89238.1 hypothetical protein [Rhodocyclaceae bacterium]
MDVIDRQNPEFDQLFDGTLYSLLSWTQLSSFWDRLDPAAGWFLYAVGESRPEAPADSEHVTAFVREIDALLRREHHEDYCGIVYADDLDAPRLIKIYDPNHLGTSCGSSKHRILPGWIMSRMPPSDLEAPQFVPQNRKRWWQGFLDMIGAG